MVWEVIAMIPALVMGGLSLAGGLIGSKSSKSPKEANAIARETLNFNKQRYNDYKKMYGGLEQQLVNDANKGVVADLGGVTARAIGDTATQFKTNKPHNYAHNNAWVLTRTVAVLNQCASIRHGTGIGDGRQHSLLTEKRKDVMLMSKHGIDAPM